MILYVQKWDILPDKGKEYLEWTKSAIQRLVSIPDTVVEFRGYRGTTGSHDVIITWEFADYSAWARWIENDVAKTVRQEMKALTTNHYDELWGPSPVVPEPIRPGK